MTEAQAFLIKAASSLSHSEQNHSIALLQSYYLMKCKVNSTKAFGLQEKHFSLRCSNCCLEWKKGTETKIRAIKRNKKQRRRLKTRIARDKTNSKSLTELLHSNELAQTCTFCKKTTVTQILKPEKIVKGTTNKVKKSHLKITNKIAPVSEIKKPEKVSEKKKERTTINNVNVYSMAKDIFSMANINNTISKPVVEAKVIKNNKKKKDKYAGLCQKAVLASAKLKQESKKGNKLNLFLKPSV